MNFQDFPTLLKNEPVVEGVLSNKRGQIYVYLSSGPELMIKIGMGLNAHQRIADWIEGYPYDWKNGKVIAVRDKENQSTAERSLHRFFENQRISKEEMRILIGLPDWAKMPSGYSEWFKVDRTVWSCFKSVGIDIYEEYNNLSSTKNVRTPEPEETSFSKETYSNSLSDNECEKTLRNDKRIALWEIDSDGSDLIPYLQAGIGNKDYTITSYSYGCFSVKDVLTEKTIATCSVFQDSDGDYNVTFSDYCTGNQLNYSRWRNKGERRNSKAMRIDVAKMIVEEFVCQIRKYEKPGRARSIPFVAKGVHFLNGSRWCKDSTTYNPETNKENPVLRLPKDMESYIKQLIREGCKKELKFVPHSYRYPEIKIIEGSGSCGKFMFTITIGSFSSYRKTLLIPFCSDDRTYSEYVEKIKNRLYKKRQEIYNLIISKVPDSEIEKCKVWNKRTYGFTSLSLSNKIGTLVAITWGLSMGVTLGGVAFEGYQRGLETRTNQEQVAK